MYNRYAAYRQREPERPSPPAEHEKRPSADWADGLRSMVSGLFGGRLETGDLLLLLILLLLYTDSRDEDFLIMMAAVFFSF